MKVEAKYKCKKVKLKLKIETCKKKFEKMELFCFLLFFPVSLVPLFYASFSL